MKARVLSVLVCSSALALSLGLAACGNEKPSADSSNTSETTQTTVSSSSSSESQDYTKIDDVDFQSVDIKVEYGDNEALEALAKRINNREANDKVVQIDGVMGSSASNHAVLEPGGTSDKTTGIKIEAQGLQSYPPDGTRVKVVGVVREDAAGDGVLVVPSDQLVTLKEGDQVIKMNEGIVTVPKGWSVDKDESPRQLIISNGYESIEFWSGKQRADELLNSGKKLKTWTVDNKEFKGYSKSDKEHELVHGTLVILANGIYQDELEDFLEYNLTI